MYNTSILKPNTILDKVEFPERLRFVYRWNGHRAIDRSNVAEHTFRVAYFADMLLKNLPQSLKDTDQFSQIAYNTLSYALVHDAGEIFTSDVSHYVKRAYSDLKDILDTVEHDLVSNFTEIQSCSISKAIVKYADIIDFSFESAKEISLGNTAREYNFAISRGIKILSKLCEEGVSPILKICNEMAIDIIKAFIIQYSIELIDLPEDC